MCGVCAGLQRQRWLREVDSVLAVHNAHAQPFPTPRSRVRLMIYLSGGVADALYGYDDIGFMLTPMMGNAPDLSRTLWGADTGCFASPHKFSLDTYLCWLQKRLPFAHTCLFATAPDVVGDAAATLVRAYPVLPQIRNLGYKASLVGQDGMCASELDWDAFDCLFLGGSTEWKLGAGIALGEEAKRRGKWVHVGRVNSKKRLHLMAERGFDSADGTYICFGPDQNVPKLLRWMAEIRQIHV